MVDFFKEKLSNKIGPQSCTRHPVHGVPATYKIHFLSQSRVQCQKYMFSSPISTSY